jgi:hypothetical protein
MSSNKLCSAQGEDSLEFQEMQSQHFADRKVVIMNLGMREQVIWPASNADVPL